MLTRRTLIMIAPLALAACSAAPADTQRYSGIYVLNWEEQSFTADGGTEAWWTNIEPQAQAAMNAARPADAKTPYGFRIRAEVEGLLGPAGAYGHLGAYKHEFTITRVISAKLEPQQ